MLDQLRERLGYLHYSIRTEEAYVYWVRAFIRFHGIRHPASMGGAEVEAFLAWLANARGVAASTHKQALSALLFFYRKVLGTDLPWMTEIGRPRTKRRLPVVLSPDEIARIFCLLEGEHLLFAQLLYGTGMRITEGLALRVKDIDFERRTIIVRGGKGGKDRERCPRCEGSGRGVVPDIDAISRNLISRNSRPGPFTARQSRFPSAGVRDAAAAKSARSSAR